MNQPKVDIVPPRNHQAQRLIDEGQRMADHPGVIFKDGSVVPALPRSVARASAARYRLLRMPSKPA